MPEHLTYDDLCEAADDAVSRRGAATSARDIQKRAPDLPRVFATSMAEWAKQRVRIIDYQRNDLPHLRFKLRQS